MAESAGPVLRLAQVPIAGLQRKLVRNPAYGGEPASRFGWRWAPIAPRPGELGTWYGRLWASIEAEGRLRNPVLVTALPEADYLEIGVSRWYVCRALGWETIPALVNDFCGRYDSFPRVMCPLRAFTDAPANLTFHPEQGLTYDGLPLSTW